MPKKLLLADDSVTIQRVIELTFSGEDVQVMAVGDGEEAMARIASERPDIVLADIGMPKRSGYEVSAFVKSKPELSHIPVLLLAGAFEPVDDAKAKEAGCDGVLVKPFEPQHVIARVRELIGGAKGSPTQPAVQDVARPAAALTAPRPVELPRREDKPPIPDDLMDIGEDDLLPRVEDLLPQDELPTRDDDLFPKVEDLETAAPTVLLDDTLDDYFDKLDEAFATISTSTSAASSPAPAELPRSEGPVLERDLEAFDDAQMIEAQTARPLELVTDEALDVFEDRDIIQPDDADVPTLDDLLADMPATPIDFPSPPSPAPVLASVLIAPPPIEPPDVTPTLAPAPAARAHEASTGRSIIADAFSALLAVEQGEPGAVIPRLAGNGSQPVVTESMIDDVARRVIERLALGSSDQMQAIVKEIVSGIAERLVREEIDRIRAQGAGGRA
jgi:CheY-like chemotaxis protein